MIELRSGELVDIVAWHAALSARLDSAVRWWAQAATARARDRREQFAFYAVEDLRLYLHGGIGIDVERNDDATPRWPRVTSFPELVTWTQSIEAELALGVLEELIGASRFGICPQCKTAWTSPDAYARRFCSDECASQWKTSHRKREDQAKVTKRVRAWRAGGGGHGKTRER